MKIAIDVDGVTRGLHKSLVEQYELDYPELWHEKIEYWEDYNIVPYFEIGDKLYHYWFTARAQEIYLQARPYPDISKINELVLAGHEIHIVTDQPNYLTRFFTLQWLYNHMLGSYQIHFVSQKSIVDCDIFFEDCPKHIMDIRQSGKIAIVRDQPWNKKVGGPRVKSISEFVKMVKEIANEKK